MADEYIRKQDVVDAINTNADDLEQNGGIPYAQGARAMAIVVEQMSPADVAPVVHGRWKYKGVCGIVNNIAIRRYKCSECREDIVCDYPYNFCPNCGAKMDKE